MTTLLLVCLFIYVVIVNASLSSRITNLELGHRNATPPAVNPNPASVPLRTMETPSSVPAIEHEPSKFVLWLKEDWLMKLGAALFIIGFGWFVSYAFANNWIGPVGRISLGILAGMAIMAFGYVRMLKYPSQGAVFMALGAGMAMLTIFAGRSIYDFFTPASAVFFDFLIVAFVSFASYKFNIRTLAFVGQVLAFIAPLLAAGQTDSIFLFTYLLVVSVATLALAGITGWRFLISSSLLFVGLYSLPYVAGYASQGFFGGDYYRDAPIILNFAYVFAMLYLLSGMFAVIRKGVTDVSNEIWLALLNGIFLFSWMYVVPAAEWKTILFSVWAVVFAASSFMAYRLSSNLAPFYAYGAVAVAYIGAATAVELQGPALVMAFVIEITLIVASILMLTKNAKVAARAAMLFGVPVFMSFESLRAYSYNSYSSFFYSYSGGQPELFSAHFFALVILASGLIISGRLIYMYSAQEDNKSKFNESATLIVFGTLYIWALIWNFMHILLKDMPDIATMATLLIYTTAGLVAYFAGLYGEDIARKTYGVILLGFVVVRLVFIDVWDMALFGRVVTFLAIGILLMGTAFLTKQKNKQSQQNYQQPQ